jgi:hypothetical protein
LSYPQAALRIQCLRLQACYFGFDTERYDMGLGGCLAGRPAEPFEKRSRTVAPGCSSHPDTAGLFRSARHRARITCVKPYLFVIRYQAREANRLVSQLVAVGFPFDVSTYFERIK